jgi:hypothetical protein
VSSLDGTQKARLATPVVNGAGETEKWLAVAASDNGRIVAVRNVPGRISRFSWFKVWEPDGTSTVEGPLNAPSGWTVYVYPLGFDLTADGAHMVYGYSNSSSCCPINFAQGTYVRPVTNSPLEPINISGQEEPTLFGSRVVAHTGATINVQDPSASTYGTDFTPWLDVSGTGLELRRTDVAANGQLAALELEQWSGGSQTIGKIGVVAIQGIDQPPTFAIDCFLPASGVAKEASLSADATRIAWKDDQGLKVAGTPTSAAVERWRDAGGDRAEKGHDEGAGRRQGRPDQGQGRPRGQGQDVRDRAGEDPQPKGQAHRRRDGIGDREARRDRDGEDPADRRRSQAPEALEGRANDAAGEPGRPQHHQARHASLTTASPGGVRRVGLRAREPAGRARAGRHVPGLRGSLACRGAPRGS